MLQRTPVSSGSALSAITVWGLVSMGISTLAGYLTVRINDSVHSFRDMLILTAWLAVCYLLISGVAGLIVVSMSWFAMRTRSTKIGAVHLAHLAGGYVFFGVSVAARGLLSELSGWPGKTWLQAALTLLIVLVALGTAACVVNVLASLPVGSWVRRSAFGLAVAVVVIPISAMYSIGCSREPKSPWKPNITRSPEFAKSVLIGLDGADWRRIEPLVRAGRLPVLEKLWKTGVSAPLRTRRPTRSPTLWTTIATGTEESKHGIHGFTEIRLPGMSLGVQGTDGHHQTWMLPRHLLLQEVTWLLARAGVLVRTPVTVRHRKTKALWTILSEQGVRVGVVNWYVTWPAEPVKGYLVSDINPLIRAQGFHDGPAIAGVTHPPRLLSDLASFAKSPGNAGDALELPVFDALTPEAKMTLFQNAYAVDRFAASAAVYINKRKVDFLAVYFQGIDRVSHFLQAKGVVDGYYEIIDALIGEVIAGLDERTAIFVVSDHGWDDDPDNFGHALAPDGLFIAAGARIRKGAKLPQTPAIVDIAPTILAVMGFPRSREMDGDVIREALLASVEPTLAIRMIDSYGPYRPPELPDQSVAATVRMRQDIEKLRALGYIQ
ncbi:MAG: alkaline phosphatase family protein [Bryobacteraceae bacterium]